jgi:hypothetical protein
MSTKGWIYGVSNPWYLKNLYKIGYTEEENPFKRLHELSSHTGVPVQFEFKFLITSDNAKNDEKCIHKHLHTYRINKDREFFEIEFEKLLDILENELYYEVITDEWYFDELKTQLSFNYFPLEDSRLKILYKKIASEVNEFVEYMKKNKYFEDLEMDSENETSCRMLLQKIEGFNNDLERRKNLLMYKGSNSGIEYLKEDDEYFKKQLLNVRKEIERIRNNKREYSVDL